MIIFFSARGGLSLGEVCQNRINHTMATYFLAFFSLAANSGDQVISFVISKNVLFSASNQSFHPLRLLSFSRRLPSPRLSIRSHDTLDKKNFPCPEHVMHELRVMRFQNEKKRRRKTRHWEQGIEILYSWGGIWVTCVNCEGNGHPDTFGSVISHIGQASNCCAGVTKPEYSFHRDRCFACRLLWRFALA